MKKEQWNIEILQFYIHRWILKIIYYNDIIFSYVITKLLELMSQISWYWRNFRRSQSWVIIMRVNLCYNDTMTVNIFFLTM